MELSWERSPLTIEFVRDRIPVFPLPLEPSDCEPQIDLKALLDRVYEEAALDLAIDYTCPPRVKLKDEDWDWVRSRSGLSQPSILQ
ncbi:DUF4058 family protein [Pseudanabaena sp. PCC 6802]|uniref:DUF4058 family protein n=1 Tax=Pseudanabaena sp. PCC 6802 TaxID=118173 RepID=UPI000347C30F|nr:DUF4058 family protein [Pseudanabaena sp. PCC 6802]